MKKLLLSSLLASVLFAEIEVVESIPLNENDLRQITGQNVNQIVEPVIGAEVIEEVQQPASTPVIGEEVVEEAPIPAVQSTPQVAPAVALPPEPESVSESTPKKEWVDNLGSLGDKVITKKSFIKGMLNGLQYNGEGARELKSKSSVKKFYNSRDNSTFWISSDYAINPNIFQMIDIIKKAPNEGLDSQKYHLSDITSTLDLIKNGDGLPENERNINISKFDIYLTDAFLTMARDLFEGEVDMRRFKEVIRSKKEQKDINYSWDLKNKSMNYVSLLSSLENSSDLQSRLLALSSTNNMLDTLKTAYAKYYDIQLQGGWESIPRGNKMRVGTQDKKRVPLLAKRLSLSGDFDDYEYAGSKFTKELSEALKHFQRRMGSWDSGVLNEKTRRLLNVSVEERLESIALNIARLRNETVEFGDEYILVNIPDFRMNFVRDNQNVLGMRVVVGRTKNPTPVFSSRMSYFELNPYWTVPNSIVKKEMLHRIQEDPDYLSSRRFKMYKSWKKGRKSIDAFDVDWWKYDDESKIPYSFVKEPGKGNPLGFVKFMFPNDHAVYMHDTNEKKFFKSPVRAYSHGCIRLQRPQELLEFLTENYTDSSLEKIESMKASKKNQSMRLNRNIPVHIRYLTSWVNEDGGVSFRKDIYGYDRMQIDLMR